MELLIREARPNGASAIVRILNPIIAAGTYTVLDRPFTAEAERKFMYVEELPGANTQGRTLEEARENLKEAVQLIIEANRELARRGATGSHIIREELLIAV